MQALGDWRSLPRGDGSVTGHDGAQVPGRGAPGVAINNAGSAEAICSPPATCRAGHFGTREQRLRAADVLGCGGEGALDGVDR